MLTRRFFLSGIAGSTFLSTIFNRHERQPVPSLLDPIEIPFELATIFDVMRLGAKKVPEPIGMDDRFVVSLIADPRRQQLPNNGFTYYFTTIDDSYPKVPAPLNRQTLQQCAALIGAIRENIVDNPLRIGMHGLDFQIWYPYASSAQERLQHVEQVISVAQVTYNLCQVIAHLDQ